MPMIGVGVVYRLSGSIGGGGTNTDVTTNPYTAPAVSGNGVYTIYNSSGSPFTFNLPATPAANQCVTIADAGNNASSFNITVQGNGNNIIAYASAAASSAVIASDGGSIALAWDGTNWVQYA